MRYADGSGLSAQGRSRREQVRLQAAEMFEQDADARQAARSLRVRAPRRHSPVVRVSGNTGRLSVAGMACVKPAGQGGSSTGSASTAGARATARACPKPTTRT